ncbi:MAG: hypothetical protein IPK22_11260 [Verrucomicrobiaceae bacterium]|nr:hypothetical protein [Verrucomicrobiaceae bacterium]
MKLLALILISASLLASCTWKQADFQRLGTKVLDAAVSTAATEAQTIQVENQK